MKTIHRVLNSSVCLLLAIGMNSVTPEAALAAGPCRVDGFTYHARIAMIDDGYTESDVRKAVTQFCSKGFLQANGNWQYPSSSSFLPTVILSDKAWVVTVYAPNGGGGGGVGSWALPLAPRAE